MATRPTLHLDPVRSAGNLAVAIEALARADGAQFPSYGAILAYIRRDYTFPARPAPLSLARLLGLIERRRRRIVLSDRALVLGKLRPATRMDVLHYLLYAAWNATPVPALGPSWAYRACCEWLWNRRATRLDRPTRAQLRADVLDAAAAHFRGAPALVFSERSVLGVRRWLGALDPPVLVRSEFRRREHCSGELLLLAIAQTAREERSEPGADLLLTLERRAAICRICLIEPAGLDRQLDRLLTTYPRFVAPGTRAGAYGRFLRLLEPPTVESLVTDCAQERPESPGSAGVARP